jgi:hypothetical protein
MKVDPRADHQCRIRLMSRNSTRRAGIRAEARVLDGRVFINLLPREFRALLSGRAGKAWHDANPVALRRLAKI